MTPGRYRPRRVAPAPSARAALAALAVAGALTVAAALAVGCGTGKPSFGALLARIDSGQADLPDIVYDNAARLAASTVDRLRVLSRARERGVDTYARVAAVVMERCPASQESVALVALDAFLSAGRPAEALALFDGPLDYRQRPLEFAEAFASGAMAGLRPAAAPERLVAAYDATGDRRFLVYAAVQAMLSGDRPLARALLVDSAASGPMGERDYRLLWDSGALDELASRPVRPGDALGLAVKADADYLRGDVAAACAGYAELVDRHPYWSWKPYAALARPEALGMTPSASGTAAEARVAASSLAEHYHDLAAERFPDDEDAALYSARWLLYSGRRAEAAARVASLSGEAAAVAGLACADPRLALPLALRLSAEYPGSARVADAALESLAAQGAWDAFGELKGRTDAAGVVTARAWFWDALAAALGGDYGEAERRLAEGGGSLGEFAEALNRGIALVALRRYGEAASFLRRAAALAQAADGEARALVLAGDATLLSGSIREARNAYEAALGAYPASREARARLERLRHVERD